MKSPIYPSLWFDGQAAAAAQFYCSVFPNSSIISENELVVQFDLNGSKMMALNGGPAFKHSEAISFVVECENQEEIDYYWEKLTQNGEEGMCGWLKDQFGVSWQIIPAQLGEWMNDPEKGQRVVQAFLKMKKFDIQTLLDA
jgi:predicted 3-demethylubiquinone-9 3-methyltransferase (glyoxalase superfamily)